MLIHVRPFIVVLLLESPIERGHEVFKGKGTATFLKEKVRAAVAREYPETEGHVPEERRIGHIPPSIEAELRAAEEEQGKS